MNQTDRRRPSSLPLVLVLALGAAAACSSPGESTTSAAERSAPTTALATPAGFVRLARSHHPLAQAQYDVGPSDTTRPAAGSIYLKLTAAQQADRDALLLAVQDPRSPRYHQWLSPADYAGRFGATTVAVAGVGSFLRSQGLQVDGVSPLGTRIGFRGTREQLQRTFRSEMHDYVVHGRTHFALASAPAIPAELADVVLGVKGLHDFHPTRRGTRARVAPAVALHGHTVLAPSDFAVLYDTKPLLDAGTNGAGVNVAIVGQSYYDPTNLAFFLQKFSLTSHVTDVLVPGTGPSRLNDDGDAEESDLDVQWSSATAPGANVLFVYTGDDVDSFTVDDAAAYIVEQGTNLVPGIGNGGAQVISESYGGCDSQELADADIVGEVAAAANLEGITYLAAAGDDGAAGCAFAGVGGLSVGPPATLPGVTAIGGTEFPAAAQAAPYFVDRVAMQYPESGGVSLETVWNDQTTDARTNGGGGGGGASTLFAKPFYQEGVTPADGARDVPDLSLTASPVNVPYYIYSGEQASAIGGTSAPTPAFAGVVAILNQSVKAGGAPLGLGNINPTLYSLHTTTPAAFHDIVTGDNKSPCVAGSDPECPPSGTYGGYSAAVGYDLASGLGSVDVAKLAAAWTALIPTTTTVGSSAPTTTTSTKVTLSAHVTSTGAASLGGTVSFAFQTLRGATAAVYAPDGGGFDESWLLGTAALTASGSGSGGDAHIDTLVPSGLEGKAYVVAMYNGDGKHLASVSAQTPIAVTGATLAVAPAAATLQAGQTTTFTATGGTPPIVWNTLGSATCRIDPSTGNGECSSIVSATPTTGTFEAGPLPGTLDVVAVDATGEEVAVPVTVSAAPDAGSPEAGAVDAAAPADASAGSSADAGHAAHDSGTALAEAGTALAGAGTSDASDAGDARGDDSAGGCTIGRPSSSKARFPGEGSLLGLVGLAFARARSRRRRRVTRSGRR